MRNNQISLPQAMEARAVNEIPRGRQWQYEPKWDGFRCLLGRSQNAVTMQSKSGQDLARYFPEIAAAAVTLPERDYVLDGELVIPDGRWIFVRRPASADSPCGKQDKTARRRDAGLVYRIRSVDAKRERFRRHEARATGDASLKISPKSVSRKIQLFGSRRRAPTSQTRSGGLRPQAAPTA